MKYSYGLCHILSAGYPCVNCTEFKDVILYSIMDSNLILGQLLALVTAACWAQNSIIYRHLGKQVGSDAVAHIRMWLALPAIVLLTYAIEGVWFPLHLSARTYFFILTSGALGYFITDKLLFQAYILLGSRESMVIMTLSPVVTAIFGFFLFSERLNGIQVLGILTTILGGVLLMVLLDRKPPSSPNKSRKIVPQACSLPFLPQFCNLSHFSWPNSRWTRPVPFQQTYYETLGGVFPFSSSTTSFF